MTPDTKRLIRLGSSFALFCVSCSACYYSFYWGWASGAGSVKQPALKTASNVALAISFLSFWTAIGLWLVPYFLRKRTKKTVITIREVEPSDLDAFFVHQLDPEANRMAAFVGKNPRDRATFDAHWKKILQAPKTTNRTIVADGQVAGSIACYPQGEDLEVTYWLGREFWGRGIATRALEQMLRLITTRPLLARVATDNLGSLRVLQKCGFKIVGRDKGFSPVRGEDTEEYLLRLDPAPQGSELTTNLR